MTNTSQLPNSPGMIALAKKDMAAVLSTLPDKDLAYFDEDTVHFDDYVEAVSWAQAYAMENRRVMMDLILVALRGVLPPSKPPLPSAKLRIGVLTIPMWTTSAPAAAYAW